MGGGLTEEKRRQLIEWYVMNLKAENRILRRLVETYGNHSKEVAKKKSQIKLLYERCKALEDGQGGDD